MSFRVRNYVVSNPVHDVVVPKKIVKIKEKDDDIIDKFIIGNDTIIYDEKSGIWKILE